MLSQNQTKSLSAAVLLALSLAPPAYAAGPSRDTGVGQVIAAQGNYALQVIRAEVKAALKAAAPALPKPRPVKVSAPVSSPAGATFVATTAVRCAE